MDGYNVRTARMDAFDSAEDLANAACGQGRIWVVGERLEIDPQARADAVPEEFRQGAFSPLLEDIVSYAELQGVELEVVAPRGTAARLLLKSDMADLGAFLLGDPAVQTVLLNLLSAYVYDLLGRGRGRPSRVTCRYIRRRTEHDEMESIEISCSPEDFGDVCAHIQEHIG